MFSSIRLMSFTKVNFNSFVFVWLPSIFIRLLLGHTRKFSFHASFLVIKAVMKKRCIIGLVYRYYTNSR